MSYVVAFTQFVVHLFVLLPLPSFASCVYDIRLLHEMCFLCTIRTVS